jgi:tetratricopeptide (TPR) repeat protein
MGKSSLMVKTMSMLRERGVSTASIDLAAELAGAGEAEIWFRGLLGRLARELKLDVEVGTWWRKYENDAIGQRLQRFMREIVGAQIVGTIVIFLDEIDSTLRYSFTDALFTAIRGMYNERGQNSAYERISFCLLGVATPSELIKDQRTTAYNIGQTLELHDFDLVHANMLPLAKQLHVEAGSAILDRILFWTGGQPYLTLRLCAALRAANASSPEEVDIYVQRTFATLDRVSTEPHFQQILRFIETRFTPGLDILEIYGRVLDGRRIREQTTPAHLELKLSGLVKRDPEGCLAVRNRIYERLFDAQWLAATRPRRKLRQYRKLVIAGGIVIALLTATSVILYTRAVYEQGQAARLREIAIGDDAFQRGDLSKAREIFEKRVASLTDSISRGKPDADRQHDLLVSLNKLGDVLLAQGDLTGAMKSYQQGLAIARNLADMNTGDAERQRDVSVSLNNLGDVLEVRGDLTAALASYQQGLAIAESLADKHPDDPQRQRDLLTSFTTLAKVQQNLGDLNAALASYKAALAIASKPEATAFHVTERDLSNLYDTIGAVQRARGDLAAALRSYQASLKIRESRVSLYPRDLVTQLDLSTSHSMIGKIQVQQGDLFGALASFKAAFNIAEQLANEDPGNTRWLVNLSVAYDAIGGVQQAQGDLAAALRSYQDSLAILDRLVKMDPANASWQVNLSASYDTIGGVQQAQGDLAAALTSYQASLEIREHLAHADPTNAGWQRELALTLGRIAAVERRQGEPANALAALQRGRAIIGQLMQVSQDARLSKDLESFDKEIKAMDK